MEHFRDLAGQLTRSSERVQHVALDGGRKELLLVVLAVDIGQVDGQILEQRGGGRTVADKGARLAAGLNFSLDKKLAVLHLDPGVFEQFGQRRRFGDFEDPRDAGARGARADHFRRRTAAQQQSQRIDHDGFAAAGLAGEQVQAGVKPHTGLFDDRVIFNRELDQHWNRL